MTILPILFFYISHLKKGEGLETTCKEKEKCLVYTKGVINDSYFKKRFRLSYGTC